VFWWNPPRGNRPICTREERARKIGGWVDGARLPARLLFYPEGQALKCFIREAIAQRSGMSDIYYILTDKTNFSVDERHCRVYTVMMSECNYSDEVLIAIETHLFMLIHGHKPDRGDRAQISNRILFNYNDAKYKDLTSVRSFYYRKHHRWPSVQEYDQLIAQLKECTTTMARPDHRA